MKHLTTPLAGADVIPVPVPFHMEGGTVQGTVIAMQLHGSEMIYLVVSSNAQTPPVWVPESEINLAYYDPRPSS
jgi:hypothetical protein